MASKKRRKKIIKKRRYIKHIPNQIFLAFPESHRRYLLRKQQVEKSLPKIKTGPMRGEIDWDKVPILDRRF